MVIQKSVPPPPQEQVGTSPRGIARLTKIIKTQTKHLEIAFSKVQKILNAYIPYLCSRELYRKVGSKTPSF